ncbi:MAG: hypothetical protein K9J25_13185 [Bacteroidales bacterium]|nr:hypothetical protein [Bacteroidales bacterium]
MKRLLLTSLLFVILVSNAFTQELETFGAGVIEFLLTNPKTAKQTDPTEAAALLTIQKLLGTTAQRKHELNAANAGRTEVIIYANNGAEAKLYKDGQGNLYLLHNNKIHPVSEGLVNQAKNINQPVIANATLQPFNLLNLKSESNNEEEEYLYEFIPEDNTISLSDIALMNNVPIENIFTYHYIITTNMWGIPIHVEYQNGGELVQIIKINNVSQNHHVGPPFPFARKQQKALDGLITPKSKSQYSFFSKNKRGKLRRYHIRGKNTSQWFRADGIYILGKRMINKLGPVFTCNWVVDFENDGLDFEDFQGIKRTFGVGDKILFAADYNIAEASTWSFNVYEAPTGENILSKTGTTFEGSRFMTISPDSVILRKGVYIYNLTISTGEGESLSKTDSYEIIE